MKTEERGGGHESDNGGNDHLHHHQRIYTQPTPPPSHSLSTAKNPTATTTPNVTTKDLSIFPPINHEGLPVASQPPPHAPLSVDSYDQLTTLIPSSPPPQPPPPPPPVQDTSQLIKLFKFALRFCNYSNLLSLLSRLRCPVLFSSFNPFVATVSVVVAVWFWLRRRRRQRWRRNSLIRGGDNKETVAHLKSIIKAKDEKIVQLLEQIAQMNKLLLARYKIPVVKAN